MLTLKDMKKFCFFIFIAIAFSLPLQAVELNSFEIQKYIDQQWVANRNFLDNLDALKIKPRLNLYSKVDISKIENYIKCDEQLAQFIDFNEKLQQQYSLQFSLPSAIINDLILQNLQLKIARALNANLLYRTKHNFRAALDQIDKSFELIRTFETNFNIMPCKGLKTVEELLCLTYYHKGKTHRMLAGYDLEHLSPHQLFICEESYLEALKYNPLSPAIHSFIGFLYIDMGKFEDALYYHEFANHHEPNNPDFIHGLAYAYFNIEKEHANAGKAINKENLSKAEEAFVRAIQLFIEFKTLNSRIYLDYGKLMLLMDRPNEALLEFNKGLSLEPNHPLLLMERGMLLGKFGRYAEASIDLKNGCIATRADNLMHKKYAQAIDKIQNLTSSSTSSNTKQELTNNNRLCLQQIYKRDLFEDTLLKCSDHIKKVKKSDKKPTCFISYAWNILEHEQWVEQFSEDLEKAGFNVILDRWFTRKGHEIWPYIEKMLDEDTDYVIVIGTKLYMEKYQYRSLKECENEHVVRIEARLINYLMGFNQIKSNKVIPVLIEGTSHESLPPFLHCKSICDFTREDYPTLMFELIRDLHQIDQRDQEYKYLINQYKGQK